MPQKSKSNALRIRNVRSPENAEMMAAARNGRQSSSDSSHFCSSGAGHANLYLHKQIVFERC